MEELATKHKIPLPPEDGRLMYYAACGGVRGEVVVRALKSWNVFHPTLLVQ